MSEKIFTISRVEDVTYDGKVTGKECFDGEGNSVKVKSGRENVLKNRWDELQVSKTFQFIMGIYQNYPFVQDFKPYEGEVPEPKPTEIAPREISREESIERHVWFKELGARIGDGSLERDYPKSHVKIKVQYYKRMSEITGVSFKEQKAEKLPEGDDIPY